MRYFISFCQTDDKQRSKECDTIEVSLETHRRLFEEAFENEIEPTAQQTDHEGK